MNTARVSSVLAKQLATIRRKKIQKLKSRIAAGRYSVSNTALAKALFLAR
jgi:anti-sigma28 factor (negative regulator of flagellin synthesis)